MLNFVYVELNILFDFAVSSIFWIHPTFFLFVFNFQVFVWDDEKLVGHRH